MTCPRCGGKTKVKGSKSDCESVHRERICMECGYGFYTEEYEAKSPETYKKLYNEYWRKKHDKN